MSLLMHRVADSVSLVVCTGRGVPAGAPCGGDAAVGRSHTGLGVDTARHQRLQHQQGGTAVTDIDMGATGGAAFIMNKVATGGAAVTDMDNRVRTGWPAAPY